MKVGDKLHRVVYSGDFSMSRKVVESGSVTVTKVGRKWFTYRLDDRSWGAEYQASIETLKPKPNGHSDYRAVLFQSESEFRSQRELEVARSSLSGFVEFSHRKMLTLSECLTLQVIRDDVEKRIEDERVNR